MFDYQRDSVMETIKLLLPLVDSTSLFDQVYDAYFHPQKYSSYKQVEDLEFFKDAVYDLIRVMLKHQDQIRIEKMYKVAIEAIGKARNQLVHYYKNIC